MLGSMRLQKKQPAFFIMNVFIAILTAHFFCNDQFLIECKVKDLNDLCYEFGFVYLGRR
jgi:hypothetical protein